MDPTAIDTVTLRRRVKLGLENCEHSLLYSFELFAERDKSHRALIITQYIIVFSYTTRTLTSINMCHNGTHLKRTF